MALFLDFYWDTILKGSFKVWCTCTIPVSHLWPANISVHVQVMLFPDSLQVPPCWQGFGVHGDGSISKVNKI